MPDAGIEESYDEYGSCKERKMFRHHEARTMFARLEVEAFFPGVRHMVGSS